MSRVCVRCMDARRPQIAIAEYLIEKGADYKMRDVDGVGPLLAAVLSGRDDVVEVHAGMRTAAVCVHRVYVCACVHVRALT
jgi:hypothetical protein